MLKIILTLSSKLIITKKLTKLENITCQEVKVWETSNSFAIYGRNDFIQENVLTKLINECMNEDLKYFNITCFP